MSKDPLEYPNIAPAGRAMYHYCNERGGIIGGIWKNSITGKFQSYIAESGEVPQSHPTFEAAYIALKMRTK